MNARRQKVSRYDNRTRGQTALAAPIRRTAPDSNYPGSSRPLAALPEEPSGATGHAKSDTSSGQGKVPSDAVPANGELAVFRPLAEGRILARRGRRLGIPGYQRYRHVMRCDEHAPQRQN